MATVIAAQNAPVRGRKKSDLPTIATLATTSSSAIYAEPLPSSLVTLGRDAQCSTGAEPNPILVKLGVNVPPRAIILMRSSRLLQDKLPSIHPIHHSVSEAGYRHPPKFDPIREAPDTYKDDLLNWIVINLFGENQRCRQDIVYLSGPSAFGLEGGPNMALERANLLAFGLKTHWNQGAQIATSRGVGGMSRGVSRDPLITLFIIPHNSTIDKAFDCEGAEFAMMRMALDTHFPSPWLSLADPQVEFLNEAGRRAFPD